VQELAAGTLLVERMQRMAGRRSQMDVAAHGTPTPWHPETPSPDGTPPPWHGADTGTRIPVRYQAPASGPIAYPDASGATIPDLAAHARAQSEIIERPRKKRRWIPVALAGMVAGAGIGFGVYLGSDREEAAPPPATDMNHVVAPPTKPPEPPKPPPEVKKDPAAGVVKPDVVVAPPKVEDPPKKDAGSAAVVDTTTQTAIVPPPIKKHAVKKWVPPVKKDPNAGKEIKKDPNAGKEVKPPEKARCPADRRKPDGTCSDI
jgi:hypothetical protein